MISTPEITLERISLRRGKGESLSALALEAAKEAADGLDLGGVIAATFSNPVRFPALSIEIASALSLPSSVPAFDLQLACSAYPYAVYLAGKLARDTGKKILVVDGDVQRPFVDVKDHATGDIFSDAVSATVVGVGEGESRFEFFSRHSTDLACPAEGPIAMDGFKVFTFVATEVSAMLKHFGTDFDFFAPHQANPYMIRQLAKSLGLADKLLTLPEEVKNPGSASVAMTIAESGKKGRFLIAGFGAGYSASAGIVRVL